MRMGNGSPSNPEGTDIISYLVPTVVEQTPRGDRSFDLFSRLLNDRIVFLGTPPLMTQPPT